MRLGTPIDYLSTRGNRVEPGGISWGRSVPVKSSDPAKRLLMLVVVAFGIVAFFFPLVVVDPPVVGRRVWSPFQVVEEAYNGNLHDEVCERCGEPSVRACVALPFPVTATYMLLIAALLPLTVAYGSHMVSGIAALGVIDCLYWARYTSVARSFAKTFYGSYPLTSLSTAGKVHVWPLQLTLMAVMAALFLIANSEIVVKRISVSA